MMNIGRELKGRRKSEGRGGDTRRGYASLLHHNQTESPGVRVISDFAKA